jgi:hypothetical protein
MRTQAQEQRRSVDHERESAQNFAIRMARRR